MPGRTLEDDDSVVSMDAARAKVRAAGVQGIEPTLGADANTYGPPLGLTPDQALSPNIKPQAQAATQAAALQSHPSTVSYGNTASNADLVATQGSWTNFAHLGNLASLYTNNFQEVKQAAAEVEKEYQRQISPHTNGFLGDLLGTDLARMGQKLFGLAGAAGEDIVPPLRAGIKAEQFLGRAIPAGMVDVLGTGSSGPTLDLATGSITPGRPYTREEAIAKWQQNFVTSLGFIPAPRGGGPRVGGEAPPPSPEAPRETPPDINGGAPEIHPEEGPKFTEDNYVADKAGNRANFTTTRNAANFLRAHFPGEVSDFEIFNDQGARGSPGYASRAGGVGIRRVTPAQAPGVNPEQTPIYTAAADADAAHVQQMQDVVAEAPASEHSPGAVEDFIHNHTSAGNQIAWIPPDAIVKVWATGEHIFPSHVNDISDAIASGRDVAIPMATYLTETAGKPFEDELNAAARFREDGVSQDEAKGLSEREAAPPTKIEPTIPEDIGAEHTPVIHSIAAKADEVVDEVFKETALDRLFTDNKAAALNKGQFEAYAARVDEERAALHDRLLQRTYDQIRRERTPEWKDRVAQHSAEVEKEIAGRPEWAAWSYLTRGKGVLGEPIEAPFKLKLDDPISQHGKDLGLPSKMFGKDGLTPDAAASVLGFDSGADMVRALADLQREMAGTSFVDHLKATIHSEATTRARQELGYDISREGMLEAAREALHAPGIEDLLTEDLKQLADRNGIPFDKAKIKLQAERVWRRLSVGQAADIRGTARSMKKWGDKAEQLIGEGKDIEAWKAKEKQLLLFHQLDLSKSLAKRMVADNRTWRRVANNPTLDNTAQDAVNWVKDILATIGRDVKGNPADLSYPINGYNSLGEFIAAKNGKGAEIIPAPVPRVPENQLTAGQYLGVSDMIKSILKNGRLEKEVQVGERKQDLEETVDHGINYLERYTRTITEAERDQPDFLQRLDQGRRYVDAWLVRLEQLMRDFGAKDFNSPFFQVVSRRLEAAKGRDRDRRLALAHHFEALNKEVGKGFDAWLKARLPSEGPHAGILTSQGDPIFNFHKDIALAALHMGDAEALQVLAEGWGTTTEEIENIVHTFGTDQMWKFAEGIWAAFENLRPEIEAMYQRLTDVTPRMVSPRPFDVPEGGPATPRHLAGGYFPIMYDPARMPKEWIELLDPQSMLGDHQYVRATPSNGYIKERTGVSAPVQKNLNQIHSRLNQVIHDLAYREALIDIQKFLMHPRLMQAISRKYGPEYVGKIRRNLERIARSESTDPNENRAVAGAVDWLTEGQMVNMIGFSPVTLMKHGFTAVFQGMAEVGTKRFAGEFANLIGHFNEVGREAEAESPEIRHIISAYGEDSYRQFLKLTEKKGWGAAFTRFAFHSIGFANKQIAIATYNAAKQMVRDQDPSLDEETVKAAANQIVRQALGSTGATDAPDALSAGRSVPGRFYRLQNNFLTFLSHMYNKSREIPQNLGYAGEKVDLARAFALLLSAIVIPVTVDVAVSRELKKGGNWIKALALGLIHQTTAPVPGLNTAVAAGMHQATGGEFREVDSPTQSLGEMIATNYKDATDIVKFNELHNIQIRHALITLGQLTKKPGLEAARLEGFMNQILQGKEQSKPIGQVVEDFIYGPKEQGVTPHERRQYARNHPKAKEPIE